MAVFTVFAVFAVLASVAVLMASKRRAPVPGWVP
jgi:hypothetical protein